MGIQKNTASISESNQFRTKFYPRLFIFTTVGVIRRRRSRSFLSLFNPRWTKLTTFQQHTSRDFLICFGRFFSSDWRQCAIPGVVIKNLFLSASSLLAQAMLEVLISAPIICVSVCLCLVSLWVFQHAPTNNDQYRVNAPETSIKCFFFFHFGNATSIFQSFPK